MRYALNGKCRTSCTLNPINLPGEAADGVHTLYEQGANREAIQAYLQTLSIRVSTGAVGRHKQNHLDPMVDAGPGSGKSGKKTHLQILEEIIEQGGSQLGTSGTRISPEMTMKAIEMHHKLTEGSVWEDFLGAIGAMGDELAGGPENPDAVQSGDEQGQGESDVVGA